MGPRLRREPQLLILHQLLEPTGLLGAQRGSLVLGGVMSGLKVWLNKTQQLLGHIWIHGAAESGACHD